MKGIKRKREDECSAWDIKKKFPSIQNMMVVKVRLCLEKKCFITPNNLTLHVKRENWPIQELYSFNLIHKLDGKEEMS